MINVPIRALIKTFVATLLMFALTSPANSADSELLCKACQMVFDQPLGAYPRAVTACAVEPEGKRAQCIGTFVATFYQARYQAHEFAVLHSNIVNRCPSEQAREYFKARLYFLATQLAPRDIPELFKNFDFGPVDLSILGRLEIGDVDPGRFYSLALAKHTTSKVS
jgi:hypothetical protein